MIELIIFSVLSFAILICLADWRKGVYLCILIGFLQDFIRKLLPGQPVYITVTIAFFAVATLIGFWVRIGRIDFQVIHSMKSYVRTPLNLFIIIVLIQGCIAFINTHSYVITGIGLLGYFFPMLGMLLGFSFVRNDEDIKKLLKFYVFVSAFMTVGIFLSYMGYDWDVLKSVGVELYIYPTSGGVLKLNTGFLRSCEVAAWHGGTSIIFIFIILFSELGNKSLIKKLISIPLIVYFSIAIILAGRRKTVVGIVLFLLFYVFLALYFRRSALKSAFFVLFIAFFLYPLGTYILEDEDSILPKYFERQDAKGPGFGDAAVQRLTGLTIGSFQVIIAQNGVLGSGAGTGSQGAQHFGGGANLVGYSAEGGLGKVLAELGVHGLIIFLWFMIAMIRYVKHILDETKYRNSSQAGLMFGMVAFLLSNGVTFMAAHQIFGDTFVLFVLSLTLGLVMGMQKILIVNNSINTLSVV